MLDGVDVGIIVCLKENPNVTTTSIAKLMFAPKERLEAKRCENGIRKKLERLTRMGLVKKMNSGKAIYDLNPDNVFFGGGNFYFTIDGGKKVHFEVDDFVVVRDTGGNFYLCQLGPPAESAKK